jgi:hypothetical protein
LSADTPPPINIEVAAPSVTGRAAQGDAAAFAELANGYLQRGLSGTEPHIIAYARASDCSRFAVLARGCRDDWLMHITILETYSNALANAGFDQLAIAAQAEALASAESMAEDGDEEMAQIVANIAGTLAPDVVAMARDLRASAIEKLSKDAA